MVSERDFTDGEPWGAESYSEVCPKCGITNEISVPDGPRGGDESFPVQCAGCGASLDTVQGFGPPRVRAKQVRADASGLRSPSKRGAKKG